MSKVIHGKTIEELHKKLVDLKKKNPKLTETQLRVHMIGQYGVTHDSKGRKIPIKLDEVFTYDPKDDKK